MRIRFIALFLLLAIVAMAGCSNSEAQKSADETLHAERSAAVAQINAKTFEYEVEYVSLKFGDSAGRLYRACHTYPPTRKENQVQCANLDARYKKALAKQKPW